MSGRKTRSVEFQDPALTASGAVGRRGIEFLRDIIAGKLAQPPIQATLGFELIEVQDGFARFQLLPGEHLYGWQNGVHGGVAAAPSPRGPARCWLKVGWSIAAAVWSPRRGG